MRLISDSGTSSRVWRPYLDPPLISPEMIQPGSGAPPGAAPLRRYLRELVAHRAAPVHTAVAFNALYFGFDTEAGGYVGGPLDIGDFPSVALGDQVEALPVGAMINVRTGVTCCRPRWSTRKELTRTSTTGDIPRGGCRGLHPAPEGPACGR